MKNILPALLFTCWCLTISNRAFAQPVTIPVVFHVVYQNTTENIHDSLLQEQLDVLNEDLNAATMWLVCA